MPRVSHHIEPQGPLQIARHYVRELIYGANDGIITTFAVVAGVAGGGLSMRVVLIIDLWPPALGPVPTGQTSTTGSVRTGQSTPTCTVRT